MTSKTYSVVKRNIRIMANSKLPSLILFLGPVFLILLTGAALQDTTLKNIKAGLFVSEDSHFSGNFLSGLEERSFRVTSEESL
jgi:hypothetical protein